jgi:hypothetical protein
MFGRGQSTHAATEKVVYDRKAKTERVVIGSVRKAKKSGGKSTGKGGSSK